MAQTKVLERESVYLEEQNIDGEEKNRDVEDEETGQIISMEEDGRKKKFPAKIYKENFNENLTAN